MAARNRLPPWHDQIRLANGREILIRPVRPDDAEPLRAGFALLGPEEIRQRLVAPLPELSAEMADRLTRPDPRTEFALVAAEPLPPGDAVVGGVARVAMVPGTRDGQFMILISSYIAGLGAGRQLMRGNLSTPQPAPYIKPRREGRLLNEDEAGPPAPDVRSEPADA